MSPEPANLSPSPLQHLVGMDRAQLGTLLQEAGVPERQIKMRTAQLWNWLYIHGVTDFDQMANIAKPMRTALKERIQNIEPRIALEQISIDGTRKWLFRFQSTGGQPVEVETVYIPEANRGTLCISSQVGCTLNCSFCHTGTQPLVRNLSTAEILGQILMARRLLGDFTGGTRPKNGLLPREGLRAVSNIVMMGMGEPLYNFENVKQALLIASDGEGIGLSKRRITLSTSGVVPAMKRTGFEIGVMLAISLHAVRDDLRDMLVPINKKWPIKDLLEVCRTYPGVSNAKRITFEYVMLKGVNDSNADARELVRLLRNIPAKINLIPFNPWPGNTYECSDWARIEAFADIVNRAGYASPVRTPRGRDIFAACGQLKSETKKMPAHLRRTSPQMAPAIV